MTETQQKVNAAQMTLGLLAPPNGTRENYPPGSTITVCYYLSCVFENCSSAQWRIRYFRSVIPGK
jgi:hypothetical protein